VPEAGRAGLRWGAILLGAVVALTLAGPAILPDPEPIDLDGILQSPSAAHWLGTDGLGRDVAARLAHGGRVSLGVGLLAAGLALVLGVPLGAAAGFRGGGLDAVVSRTIEALLCFPTLVVALAILAAPPPPLDALPAGLRVAFVLGGLGWMTVARYVRGEVLRLRGSEVVAAARAAGAGDARILVRHILPAALAPALVSGAFSVGSAILAEAGLSFLGMGVGFSTPSWGALLFDSRTLLTQAWWLAAFPGLALFATVLACNLLAEGVRSRLDPHSGTLSG
jgi:peptide/nickel transport system permease protein